jgi:hypothetical protein
MFASGRREASSLKNNEQQKKLFYGLGFALIGLGVLVLSIALGQVVRTTTRGYHPLSLPGRYDLTLKPGLYLGVGNPQKPPLPSDAFLGVRVDLQGPDGLPIPVERTPGAVALMMGNRTVQGVFQFEVMEDGPHVLTAEGPLAPEPSLDILLVHESLASNRSDVTVGIILFLVLACTGIYTVVSTRRK